MPGGRPKGATNRKNLAVRKQIEDTVKDCNPIEGLIRVAESKIKCGHCKKGKVTRAAWYKLNHLKLDVPEEMDRQEVEDLLEEQMTCPICAGSNYHPVPLDLRANAYKELACYYAPKRKPVDAEGDSQDKYILLTEQDLRL